MVSTQHKVAFSIKRSRSLNAYISSTIRFKGFTLKHGYSIETTIRQLRGHSHFSASRLKKCHFDKVT